jgi:hypothetical protein
MPHHAATFGGIDQPHALGVAPYAQAIAMMFVAEM